jgi:serine/threonine-protein kinase HipA
MSRRLDVYLGDLKAGTLEQDAHGQIFFTYAPSWLENEQATPLSQSLPLGEKPYNKNECLPFFSGILPEEEKREIIAKNLGVSARNPFSLLERIGGECGGAVELITEGVSKAKGESKYAPLSEAELVQILKELPRRPLLAGERGVRLSLAGVQDKIPLYFDGKTYSLPLENSPSTHILKPAITRFEGQVYNEALALKLAKAMDIPTAQATWKKMDEVEFLLVARYDRKLKGKHIIRIHQEDFCQALGIVPEMKYQSEGGPGLKECFELVKRVSSRPLTDLENLLKLVLFNLLIGNNDAHGKNFSLLYEGGSTRLAPAYDLIATAYYKDLDPHMAMKLGKESLSLKVGPEQLGLFAKEVQLTPPLVLNLFSHMAKSLPEKLKAIPCDHPQEIPIRHFLIERAARFLF